ncbi:disease resistance protein RGA2-like [Carex rostrata]
MTGLELLVGGWFASPVIKSVVEKAQKYLGANYELQQSTQGMVEELTCTLVLIQATVKEVEKRTIINNNPDLATWLRMLKETVHDAEDVLDNMEAKLIKEKVQGKNKVSKLASTSLSVVSNMFSSDDNLKSLKKAVNHLNKLSTAIPSFLNLVNMNKNNESHIHEVTDQRETISQSLEKVDLYGRDNEMRLILEIILGSESESSKMGGQTFNYHGIFVIPIVGMGGVGKTALAQAIYNNPEVQETFAKRAWISVSNKTDVVLVMRKIIQSLRSRYPFQPNAFDIIFKYPTQDEITLEDISENLSLNIQGVKFLIVLDDMFDSQWEYLYGALSRGAPGSVLLITTQNQIFANRVGTFGAIALSALDMAIFWELFQHFAFRNEMMSEERRRILISIGRRIADKLGGLPLAAKIIGNILRTNVDEVQWGDIAKSEWWDIDVENQILQSIGLGYEQLTPNLRQCFSYCAVLPRNSLIEKDRLVHMWIAQNFIQSDIRGVKKIEDIGRQWFDELVEKCFFQRAGDTSSYVMHELMHDLAVIVSSGECFYFGEGVVEIPLGVRHLAVDTNNLEVIKGIKNYKNLRSFLYFGCCQVEGMYSAINDTLSNLDSIRVLDLSYMCMDKELKPPTSIWNLQHLRFLDLSCTGIKLLTHSSINLYHLQALYIRKCKFQELPSSINKLINLRHLFADNETIAQISGIGQLTNLQELGAFYVGEKEGHRITELRNLREIRGALRIENYYHIKNKDEAKLANLVDKKHLHSICLYASHTGETNVDMDILEELQPHKDIKDLRIRCYTSSVFPNWIIHIGNFQNLNTVYLSNCVSLKVLPPLGELPSLKFLRIEHCYSIELIDYHLYGEKQTVFPLLEELYLYGLKNCKEWTGAQATEFFPCLSKLTISCNTNLRNTPLPLFSSPLKELIINDCSSLISLEQSIRNLSSLIRFKLCYSSMIISINPLDMPLLEDLSLGFCSELKIEGDVQSLTRLKRLTLVSCSKLFTKYSTKDQQKGKGLQVHQDEGLRSLTHIEADHSLLHHEYHLILGSVPSLRVFIFKNTEFTQFTNDQILWFQKLTTLKEIHFSNCKFDHLPASLTRLSSLKKVVLQSCTKLKSLSDSMPPNLQKLFLFKCSRNLVQLCQEYKDQDQQFISSIPVIHVDNTTTLIRKMEERVRCETKPEFLVARMVGSEGEAKGEFYPSLSPLVNCTSEMDLSSPHIELRRGLRACASCGKTFQLTDFVLYDFNFTQSDQNVYCHHPCLFTNRPPDLALSLESMSEFHLVLNWRIVGKTKAIVAYSYGYP